ncbi:D-alanyl-D-alanine carboxypeptidase/D-alanyl-D-alanine endopeptidase [Dyella mobilis]|uniref:D-alanyl-D-alanine carboxypeptidase/D-alanyl-D-alanine-endopeptidase n=1 Tax=Dyella mobilis TaxID=1849582 RepID=A0ABS2KKQ7_9GAMM|nr:D-alanyl-D-alanine carboxypeptidase/D-alanyl-D-alanine-endopeptidase [Dyella mobilis]MBM7131747.1 D-alanyl-D-alanine carboxypeptidase/D-alanyl-D-alanine-endopeptidase [Dyella mobilis]GLQ96276.1 peptidase M15 [Dyella mobilis]
MKAFSLRYLPWIAAACLFWNASANAQSAPPSAADTAPDTLQQLAKAIDQQIGQPRFASSSWGIAVTSLDTGRTLYAHEAHRLLQPASTAKLYTAALVLDTLGTDYRIPTQLLATGPIVDGQLRGALVLHGMGDPTLGTPQSNDDWADQLANQLAAKSVREVQGDLVADDSYFNGPAVGSGWEAGDLQSWFAVPASALSVRENTVALSISPSSSAGHAATLEFDPQGAFPHVANTLATEAHLSRNDINLYRAPGDGTLYVFGHVAQRTEPQNFKLAMPDPAWFAGTSLREALARHGIRVTGQLRTLHWPEQDTIGLDKAVVVAQVLSPPLLDVLTQGLKRSQNLYLQNLLQIAGVKARADAERAGDPAPGFLSSEAWGIRALRELLDRIGISPDASQMEEGTGLSRQDLATPDAMVHLLGYLAAQPYGDQLRDALPSAGVDGTLEWRMRDTTAMGNVHAKTGSMTHVRCIAGYVTTASGEHLAFAIMLNNFVREDGGPSPSRNLDAIVELLAAFRGHS